MTESKDTGNKRRTSQTGSSTLGRRDVLKLGAGVVGAALAGNSAAAQAPAPGSVRAPGLPRPHTSSGYKNNANRLGHNGAMDDTSRTIVRFVSEFNESRLTDEIVKAFNRTMIDSLAAIISGYEEEPVRIAARVAQDAQPAPGRLKSTVFGYGISTTPELAAFANGVQVRMTDFNDNPHTSNIIPGILAIAEAVHATGPQTMTAIVVGYEVSRVGGGESIAPALAAGKLLGLDEDRLANALTIALTPHVALNKGEGALSMWKGVRSAEATKCGIWAAILARAGMTGPPQPFEGPGALWSREGRRNVKLPVEEKMAIELNWFKARPAEASSKWWGQPVGLLATDGKLYQLAGTGCRQQREDRSARYTHRDHSRRGQREGRHADADGERRHHGEGASEMTMTRRLALLASVVSLVAMAAENGAAQSGSMPRYRLVPEWAHLPAGTAWGVMTAVGIDTSGNIFAFQRSDPDAKVLVFDSKGNWLRTWGENTFVYPHGLRVLADGAIWIADRQMQQVIKFDREGKRLMTLGVKNAAGTPESTDRFNGASDVALGANREIYVSDGEGGNARIVKFSADGHFLKYWGGKGADPGQLNTPHALAVDSRGRVWVCDRGNKRLQIFDAEGAVLAETKEFGTPVSIAFGTGDLVFVAAGEPENFVTIGTLDGKVLGRIEGLNSPHGIAVAPDEAIYVAESAGKAVLKYVRE